MSEVSEAVLTVDLDALAANFAVLRREAGGAEVAPALKADGYGLGVGPIARRLWAEGARRMFVARLSEGLALRAILPEAQIYVLDGCMPGEAARFWAAGLTPVLNSLPQIETWLAFARGQGRTLEAAIHVDTGMNRLGLRPEEADMLVAASDRLRGVEVGLIMSHLACAGEPSHPLNARQAERFAAVRALFPDARASLANTAGTFSGPAYRFDMVRPGVGLYGGGPFEVPHPGIAAVARLDAPILQIRSVPVGESVGYGATWTAARPTRAAILAAGFADGVLRGLGARGYGWLHGRAWPFIGRISMDLIAIDVTEADSVQIGERVQLLGPDVPLDEVARAAGTVPYEVLTRPAHRIARRYIGAGA